MSDKEIQNLKAIGDFVHRWDRMIVDENGTCAFECEIVYHSRRYGDETFEMKALIERTGYDGPKIHLLDGKDSLDSARYHGEFSYLYGNMHLTVDTGSLIITDESNKMGGVYTVEIRPIRGCKI